MCTFKKVCVTNRHLTDRPLYEQLKVVFAISKPDVVILREKDLSEDDYRSLAYRVKALCDMHDVKLIINKHYNVARELHTPVQLSVDDYKLYGVDCADLSVGASIHSLQEAIVVGNEGADFIVAGHIFETDCKRGLPGRGIEFLTSIVEQVDVPVYAIGGIDEFNIEEVASTGASGACQMSFYMNL
ncbi:thiamine phosphate synthase [Mogibacterium diversum]|uniref:thiamine phosphate synthase n=1 Tax=Mogibacterium diversum TaxID=114527 RepID=UPI0028D184B5|nr:thiamine phosphate synthase [Mogibacterium diversum]